MYTRIAKFCALVLFCLVFFAACGEMDGVLLFSGTYQVDALVNDISLNKSSLIKKSDTIRPYFINSIANDPDVSGLAVFLETTSGEIIGRMVQYILDDTNDTTETAKKKESEDETVSNSEKPENQIEDGNDAGMFMAPKNDNTVVRVKSLNKKLPPMTLPEGLSIGQYIMVFQVLGEQGLLYRAEKPVYYLGDARFILHDINRYLPGSSAGLADSAESAVSGISQLIPPGITVMLEARVDFDKRLDPYIVWYNGRKRISEGKISEGAGIILWHAPEQTAFTVIRAEVFPYKEVPDFAGKRREISLPVSSKVENLAFFSGSADFIQWYQFSGNLRDSMNAMSSEKALIPSGENQTQWLPANSIYGLAAGEENSYILPDIVFAGNGRLQFHFKPVAGGSFLKGRFNSDSLKMNTVKMELSLDGENLVLSIRENVLGLSQKISAALPDTENGELVTVFVDFSMDAKYFAARLVLENQESDSAQILVLPLGAPLSGKANFQLGSSVSVPMIKEIEAVIPAKENSFENTAPEDPIESPDEVLLEISGETPNESPPAALPSPVITEKPEAPVTPKKPYLPVVIFDELAIVHTAVSIIPPEEVLEDDDTPQLNYTVSEELPENFEDF
jgi:hypothetical protein